MQGSLSVGIQFTMRFLYARLNLPRSFCILDGSATMLLEPFMIGGGVTGVGVFSLLSAGMDAGAAGGGISSESEGLDFIS